jgi:hypothetical protein
VSVAGGEAELDWQSFMMEPIRYIEPSRFHACFEGAIGPKLCERLRGSPRLQSRLSTLVRRHYQLMDWIDPDQLDDADRALVLASIPALQTVARRAGAIYWSGVIASTVLAKAVTVLHKELGAELCSFAIAQRDLSGPAQSLEPLDGLGLRIEADGWRCLAGWCATLPAGVGVRVRLKLPQGGVADEAPLAPFAEQGPAIVRRAAA